MVTVLYGLTFPYYTHVVLNLYYKASFCGFRQVNVTHTPFIGHPFSSSQMGGLVISLVVFNCWDIQDPRMDLIYSFSPSDKQDQAYMWAHNSLSVSKSPWLSLRFIIDPCGWVNHKQGSSAIDQTNPQTFSI